MDMTRNGFLKLAATAAALTHGGVALGTVAAAVATPPDGVENAGPMEKTGRPAPAAAAQPLAPVAGALDSQRFRGAVASGDTAQVADFLRRDPALAYSRDGRGRTVLALACLAGRREVAALLRQHLTGLGLVEAALAGDRERVQWWLGKAPGLVNEPDATGWNAVHAAVLAAQPELVASLVVRGADFNSPSSEPPRRTPLRLAAESPDAETADELVDLMLGNGADANAAQGDGISPLHAAASAGRIESVRLLIASGAVVEARTPADETALALAERRGHAEVVALLRQADRLPRLHRSSRYAATAAGGRFTPPPQPALPVGVIDEYVAVAHGNLARVRELLALYPSLLLANATWNELAVEAGAHTGFKDGVRLQLEAGAPCALPTAAMMGMTGRVRALLDEDPLRIHDCGAHNMPLIWFPAIGGASPEQLEIARLLLDRGVAIDGHKRGYTALHWAARAGHLEMAELLLARGAAVNLRAQLASGQPRTATPLALAEKSSQRAMADLLRRHGGVV
jgi:uncharacterized protein